MIQLRLMFTSLTDPQVVELLRKGGVGVLLTDTIYGLVCGAAHKDAVARLYHVKHREGKPGTVVAASVRQVVGLGIADVYVQPVAHLWPNPVSIVLPAPSELAYLDQGKRSLAIRVTKDEQFRLLLEQTGPLLTSSANQPGEPPAMTIDDAVACFGDTVDFYIDGGTAAGREASTVGRLNPADNSIEVLRQGSIVIS